jgi:CRP-like cAMP-binding protein
MIAALSRPWHKLFAKGTDSDSPVEWQALLGDAVNIPDDAPDFWKQTAKAIDPRFERPHARPEVTVEPLPDVNAGSILCDEKNGTYLQLASEDVFLWQRMDGTRTQIDLVVDYMMQYKAMAPARVAELVETLRSQGLLGEPPDELYMKVVQRIERSTLKGAFGAFTSNILYHEFAIKGIDGLITAVYKAVGRVVYNRPAQIIFWLVSLTGLVAFVLLLASQQFSILGKGELATGAVTLAVFEVLSIFLHEWGHALTVKAFGRKVRRAGFFFLFGLVGVFVDTTDIWPAGKRGRLAVTWAGPFCNMILGGISALLIFVNREAGFAPLAYQFAVSQYSLILLNLTPFLRLDGYYLLSDGLDIPNLRDRASSFLRVAFVSKLKTAWREGYLFPKLSREETILLIFGGLTMLWLINLLGLAVITAPVRMVQTVRMLIQTGFVFDSPMKLAFTVVGLIFTAALLARMVNAIRTWVKRTGRNLQQAKPLRTTLTFGLVALIVALIPDVLSLNRVNSETVVLYTRVLSLIASGLAAIIATRLVRELRGAGLRVALLGMAGTSFLLVALDLTALADLALPVPLLPDSTRHVAAALALIPAALGSLMAMRDTLLLFRSPLRGSLVMSLLAAGALMARLYPLVVEIEPLLTVVGRAWLAAALLMHWYFVRRTLVMPRVALTVTEVETGAILSRTVGAVMREMAQALNEIAGRPALLKLVADFNGQAADADWSLWLTMGGSLGDRTIGTADERAPSYRAALAGLRGQIGAVLGGTFAVDAQARAVAELPLVLRAFFHRWINDDTDGVPADDDRVRLRLAGRRLAETLVIGCARIYGWRLTEQAIGRFNRMAATADWPLYIRGNGRMADDLQGDLLHIAQIYADALQDLLGRLAAVAGAPFVERGVIQVYDGLPWEVRETATTLLFQSLSWAHNIAASEEEPKLAFLHTVPLLNWLAPSDLETLAAQIAPRTFNAGDTVIPIGTYLENAYVVRHGRLNAIQTNGGVHRTFEQIGVGGIIGVRSILDMTPTPYQYVAQTDMTLWLIPKADVTSLLAVVRQLQGDISEEQSANALLARVPLFSGLGAAERASLGRVLKTQRVSAGTVILEEGQPSKGFYIVREGELDVLVRAADGSERLLSHLGLGEFFGESALMTGNPISATIQARTDATLLRLGPEDFFTLVAARLAAPMEQLQTRRAKERMQVQQMAIPTQSPADV